jgi:phospholipase C
VGESPSKWRRRRPVLVAAATLAAGALVTAGVASAATGTKTQSASLSAADSHVRTTTPIKHVVVLFDENISFDHYFGTYPKAANTDGTKFVASRRTPKVDGLTKKLLTQNPNQYQPKRLTPAQALTCDQNHAYGPEEKAFDGGKMDQFVQFTDNEKCAAPASTEPGLVMDYYDGNTVTGLWNYAQHYSLGDNSYGATFGPSTPGALELVSGQTHGVYAVDPKTGKKTAPDSYTVASPDKNGIGTEIDDPDPAFDDCSDTNHTSNNNLGAMTGQNIGDLLNKRNVSWGWFQGGFRPNSTNNGSAVCTTSHPNVDGVASVDYSPHHNPFEYYKSTSNPHHVAPKSVSEIGHNGQANHQYDLTDFDSVLKAGRLPAVSFLKAGSYQDGHAGYSDPLDEQHFLVSKINEIQKSKDWASTAIVIAYDDSDGWYDHKLGPAVNGSNDPANDQAALCGTAKVIKGQQDRCGVGPRLPLLVISPYAKVNHVDHTFTNQASIDKFIEQNWRLGSIGDGSFDAVSGSLNGMFDFWGWNRAPRTILNPTTGAVTWSGRS